MAQQEMNTGQLDAGALRRNSAGVIEIQDSKGRRKTVQLDELSAADRALAEQFGYKPVREDNSNGGRGLLTIIV